MQHRYPKVTENSLLGRAYQVIDTLSGGKSSDDNPISNRLMMRNIVTAYGQVLREDLMLRQDRGEEVNAQMYRDYTCQNMELVEDCNGCRQLGVTLKKVKIPKLAQFAGLPLIRFVGTSSLTFSVASSLNDALSMAKSVAFNPGRASYYLSGDYLFVALPGRLAMICSINYSIIPEDPSFSSTACFNIWAEDFPIDDYMWSVTFQRLITGNGNVLLSTMQGIDKINNGREGNEII